MDPCVKTNDTKYDLVPILTHFSQFNLLNIQIFTIFQSILQKKSNISKYDFKNSC